MGRIVGIDLGTTFSAISHLNEIGKPDIFSVDGERIVPSAVHFESSSKFHVGSVALTQMKNDSKNVARWIKKTMGSPVYNVTNTGKEVEGGREINGRIYTPAELSSFILKHLAVNYEKIHGPIAGAVVTVPAYFNDPERKATMEAAHLAGLNILGIVNEPTAAALYYSSIKNINGTNLVFDLGGGTFDLTILEVNGNEIEIIASEGDRDLGGFDFDKALKGHFESSFYNVNGSVHTDTDDDKAANQEADWFLKSESTKIVLSKYGKAQFVGSMGLVLFNDDIQRESFEKLIAPQLSRIQMLMELILDDKGMSPSDIDNVILCGGSSRVPAVRERIRRVFGKDPIEVGNLDEAVSLGAAIYAGILAIDQIPNEVSKPVKDELLDFNLSDVCTHSFGTNVVMQDEFTGQLEERNDIILRKNTRVPAEVKKTYYTMHANQTFIEVKVTQGESSDLMSVNTIEDFVFDLPSGRESNLPVEVTYRYDKNMMMECEFHDVTSGRKVKKNYDFSDTAAADTDLFDDFDL